MACLQSFEGPFCKALRSLSPMRLGLSPMLRGLPSRTRKDLTCATIHSPVPDPISIFTGSCKMQGTLSNLAAEDQLFLTHAQNCSLRSFVDNKILTEYSADCHHTKNLFRQKLSNKIWRHNIPDQFSGLFRHII